MANEPIIKALQTFKERNESSEAVDNEQELQSTVVQLSERVQYLETLLTEVSKIGGALKSQTRTSGGDPNVIRLAEKLAAIDTMD